MGLAKIGFIKPFLSVIWPLIFGVSVLYREVLITEHLVTSVSKQRLPFFLNSFSNNQFEI